MKKQWIRYFVFSLMMTGCSEQQKTIEPVKQEEVSYEAFYDEYCAFIKKYNENPADLTRLADYTQMLQKAAEMDVKFIAWDESEMNNAELSYSLEVSNRMMQKLLDVSQSSIKKSPDCRTFLRLCDRIEAGE